MQVYNRIKEVLIDEGFNVKLIRRVKATENNIDGIEVYSEAMLIPSRVNILKGLLKEFDNLTFDADYNNEQICIRVGDIGQ